MKTLTALRQRVATILLLLTTVGIMGQQQVDTDDLADLDLEDLMNMTVSSSSFFTLKSSETPGYIYSLDLNKVYSSQSLIENVRMVIPGMYDGAHTDTEVIGVRGMKAVDNSKTMVMFDGQSLNQRANVGYGLGLTSKLIGDVKSVEVCLGPNAIVHGSGAISGYINMTPKNGYDNPGLFANVSKEFEANADNKANFISKIEAGYGFGTSSRNVFVYAGYYNSDGWSPDSSFATSAEYNKARLDTIRVNNTEKPNFRISTHANFDGLTLNVGYMQNYRSSKLGAQDNFQRQLNAKLKYTLSLGDAESVDFVLADEQSDLGRFSIKKGTADKTIAGGAENHVEGKVIFKTTRFNNNSLALGALYGSRNFHAGEFFFGSDFNYTYNDCSYITDPNTGNSYADSKNKPDVNYLWASGQMPEGKWKEMAFFAEDIYKMNDNLVMALGLRYDHFKVADFDDNQSNLAPRFAVSYLVNDNHVVKASYQQGFRTMDYYNMGQTKNNKVAVINYRLHHYGDNRYADKTFNIKIEPEKVHSVELNYHGDFASKAVSLDVNAFYNIYKNTIDFIKLSEWTSDSYLADPDNYKGDHTSTGLKYFSAEELSDFMFEYISSTYKRQAGKYNYFGAYVNNGDDIKIIGGEVIATATPTTDTRVNVAYSFAKSLTDSYADISQCPTSQLKASATQFFLNKNLVLNAQFLFEPSLKDNEQNHENYHDVYFTPRTTLDLAAAYTFVKGVTLQFTVNNVTAEERPGITYKPSMKDNYPQLTKLGENERQYWLSLKLAF